MTIKNKKQKVDHRHGIHAWQTARLVPGYIGMFIVLFVAAGCPRPQKLSPVPSPILLTDALTRYNDNVEAVGAFSAKISQWEAVLHEDDKSHKVRESGGKIFFAPPDSDQARARLSLRASASFYDLKALILGSNDEEFWMIVTPQKFGMWGRYDNLEKPCGGKLPFDPQQILDLAGLKTIPDQPAWSPYPVYKVLPEDYVIEYVRPSEEGLWLQREIVIDRRTDHPREIKLYDREGLCLGRSELSEYLPLENGFIPGRIRLIFKDERERDNIFQLKLTRPRPLTEIHPLLFERPEEPTGLDTYQQIDKDCDEN